MTNQTGKVAIVTGAGSGIGGATAEALARAGYTVFGTSRKPGRTGPQQVTMMECDVTDDASAQKLIANVTAKTGRIDLLVNNAGLGHIGAAEESSVEQAKALFEVNFFGVMRMTNAALPWLRKNSAGRVINISSVLGFLPAPFAAYYSASKHAVEGYSESLDHESRAFGVRVVLIEPAFTKTAFDQSALKPDRALPLYDKGRSGAEQLNRKGMLIGDDPSVVADAVILAATAVRPLRRYTAGKQAKQFAFVRRFVPAGMFDKTLRKQYGLPKVS
jgi:NAD(P)-dependent dehydrogenase (short-subunit alcohol dehydrogenase family)